MSRMEQRERRENRTCLIRFLLCTVLGLGTGALIGYPTTPTIAVSAILMLYIDRGYTGSLRYSWRRVRVQVLMGGIGLLLVLPLQQWTPLPLWAIEILAAAIAITIGLPLQYRYQIAPLTVTMGNATLIMVTGIAGHAGFYWERVLFCVLGAVIAHIVNFVVVPREDRYQDILAQLREDVLLLSDLLLGQETSQGILGSCKRSETFLDKHVALLKEDSRWRRHRLDAWRYNQITGFLQAERELIRMAEDLTMWGHVLEEPFLTGFRQELQRFLQGHLAQMGQDAVALPELPGHPERVPQSPGETVLLADLIRYCEALRQAGSALPAQDACPRQPDAQPPAV